MPVHGGRKRSVNVREVWTECQWKALPKRAAAKSTCAIIWDCGTGRARIHHRLYVAVRESPTVAIIDTQTAKGAQKGVFGSILQATTRARRSKVARHIPVGWGYKYRDEV
jgi:hypothetical protein